MSAAHKTQRAEAALAAAIAASDHWRTSVPLDMVVTVEPKPDGFDAVVRLANLPEVPTELSLLLDDFFHHARSALDHVIWQLVIDSHEPTKKQAFPVLKSEDDRRIGIETRGIAAAALEFVKSVQPYNFEHYRHSFLWRLHRLDVVTKHRSILPTSTFLDQVTFNFNERVVSESANGIQHQLPNPAIPSAFEPGLILRTLDVPEDYDPQDPAVWIQPNPPILWIAAVDDCEPIALTDLRDMLLLVRHIIVELNETREVPAVWD